MIQEEKKAALGIIFMPSALSPTCECIVYLSRGLTPDRFTFEVCHRAWSAVPVAGAVFPPFVPSVDVAFSLTMGDELGACSGDRSFAAFAGSATFPEFSKEKAVAGTKSRSAKNPLAAHTIFILGFQLSVRHDVKHICLSEVHVRP